MKSVNKSEAGKSPRALPVITLGEAKSNHSRNSSSLSSSTSSSSGLVIGLDVDDVIQDNTLKQEDARLGSDNFNDDFQVHPMPSCGPHSSDSSSTESPPAPVTEKPAESPESTAYRIPSSVFARTKSTAPMEWSVTSNESLFSIQMGNMSLTREHANWVGKSGELNYQGDSNFPSHRSGPLIDMPSNQPPTPSNQSPEHKSTELEQKNAGVVNEPLSVAETKAAETMPEVITENEDSNWKEKAQKVPCSPPSLTRSSDASGSTKSFAFPILTEDKSSRRPRSQANSQPATPRVAQRNQADRNSQTQRSETPKTENEHNKSQSSKWLSCFSCCPNSSSGSSGRR